MKHILIAHSRLQGNESAAEKHYQFMNALKELQGSWGIVTPDLPPMQSSAGLGVDISLTRYLPTGVGGGVTYINRASGYDSVDSFELNFTPKHVNYSELFGCINCIVKGFQAYQLTVSAMEFISWARDNFSQADPRNRVSCIYPVHFMDEALCYHSFALSAKEVFQRLSACEQLEQVQMVNKGVLIIASSKIMSLDEQKQVNQIVRSALDLPSSD